ncbi:hypothetical protein PM082_023132 [Marasmius tenuissimus]|nr:hypothetical protein PM082_023132 [Marasmius tenuissimus]
MARIPTVNFMVVPVQQVVSSICRPLSRRRDGSLVYEVVQICGSSSGSLLKKRENQTNGSLLAYGEHWKSRGYFKDSPQAVKYSLRRPRLTPYSSPSRERWV